MSCVLMCSRACVHMCGFSALSWRINLKFGAMVFMLHDASDIGIDMLKMVR